MHFVQIDTGHWRIVEPGFIRVVWRQVRHSNVPEYVSLGFFPIRTRNYVKKKKKTWRRIYSHAVC